MRTFSKTESCGKMLVRWKERAMPKCERRALFKRVMGDPLKRISPSEGCKSPLRRLKSVVFPAPLGPMIEWSVPSRTSRSTPLTATWAPKRLESLRVCSNPAASQSARRAQDPRTQLPEPAAQEEHDTTEDDAQQERPARPHLAEEVREDRVDGGTENGAVGRADAAQQSHDDDVGRRLEIDGLERDELVQQRVEGARKSRDGAGDRERGDLETAHVVADRFGALDVLANGAQDVAEGRVDDAQHEVERGEKDGGHDVVVRHRVRERDAEKLGTDETAQAVVSARDALHLECRV